MAMGVGAGECGVVDEDKDKAERSLSVHSDDDCGFDSFLAHLASKPAARDGLGDDGAGKESARSMNGACDDANESAGRPRQFRAKDAPPEAQSAAEDDARDGVERTEQLVDEEERSGSNETKTTTSSRSPDNSTEPPEANAKICNTWDEERKRRRSKTASRHSTTSMDSAEESRTPRRSSPFWAKSKSFRSPKPANPEDRRAAVDDAEGRAEFFLTLLYESLEGSKRIVGGAMGILLVWSVLCAYFAERLREAAEEEPGGRAERWVEDIQNCKSAVSIIGTLFVFTLVFRFNTCYDRWWDSRVFWGDIISRCLDLNMMNRRWIADPVLGDRMSRFIIAYSYACKALLRGTSLAEDRGDGPALVARGILTREELDDMHDHPCWQPHFCLEVIRAVLVEAHKVPGGKGITFDADNKIHGQVFRCFDGVMKQMTDIVGDTIRTRASGLPASYDAITMTSFFAFFVIAAFVWSPAIGWMTPLIVGCASFIIMLLIEMGSKLVDPFGYDKVDIPMEAFCATIEAQVTAIDERSKRGVIEKISRSSTPRAATMERASSTYRIPKL